MLLTRPKTPAPPRGGGPLSSRGGTLLVAALLTMLAASAMLVFLRGYRDDLTASDTVQVLVAKSLVPKGTPGEVLAEKRLYKLAEVKKDRLSEGALTDPAQLEDQAVTKDILPGHQMTVEDLESANGSVGSRLTGFDRAMSVPTDKAHGMSSKIDAGDRVDVIVTFDVADSEVAARNALVLAVPEADEKAAVTRKEQVTIRVPDGATRLIAEAVDYGEVWLVLRPPVGARSQAAGVDTDAEAGADSTGTTR